MAKQSSNIRNDINTEGRRINTDSDNFMNMIQGRINNPGSSPGAGYRNQAAQGFQGVLNRGPSKYDPMFMDAAKGGLVTDENRNRIRGNGGFDEFAKTGGYNEGDLANIRSRSNRSVPAFYSALKNQFKTAGQVQGQGPSYNASLSRMGRDQSRQAGEQAVDTELGIKKAVNEGRQYGISGMSGAETGLANLESANKRFGISGGAQNELANSGLDLEALKGILGVGNSANDDEFKLYDMLLGNMGQRGSLQGNNLSRRASYDPNVSWFDRMMQIWSNANNSARAVSPEGLR